MNKTVPDKAKIQENLAVMRDAGIQRIGEFLFHIKDVIYIQSSEKNLRIGLRSGREIMPLYNDADEDKLRAAFIGYHGENVANK